MPVSVIYLFDPLCGWCYGAAPALDRLQLTPWVSLSLAPSGLFAGEGARPMDAQFAAYAWSNDQRIQQLTGQPFTDAYRDNILHPAAGRFDSGPATWALTAVARTQPGRELEALHAFQRSRFVEGRDTARPQVLAEVLNALGLTEAAAQAAAPDPDLHQATAQRVQRAQAMLLALGAHGVPQLVVTSDSGTRRLLGGNVLMGPHERLLEQLLAA